MEIRSLPKEIQNLRWEEYEKNRKELIKDANDV